MKRSFGRSFEQLPAAFEFTAEFYASAGIDEKHRFAIDFAIEEIFTNMVKYNPQAKGQIHIELERNGGTAHVVLVDRDVEPFDVTASAPPDTEAPLEQRQVGGLGLHLTRQLMSTVDYEHDDRTSRIAMTKELD